MKDRLEDPAPSAMSSFAGRRWGPGWGHSPGPAEPEGKLLRWRLVGRRVTCFCLKLLLSHPKAESEETQLGATVVWSLRKRSWDENPGSHRRRPVSALLAKPGRSRAPDSSASSEMSSQALLLVVQYKACSMPVMPLCGLGDWEATSCGQGTQP